MKASKYKAFDFNSGYTFLIGEHPDKTAAMGYCRSVGIQTIAQTLVPLTDEEYERAIRNRREEPWEQVL